MSARRPSLALLFLAPAALAAGGALGVWLYKRWGYPVDENERDVPLVDTPPEPDGPGLQPSSEGVGPRFHRRYRIRLADADWGPREVMADIARDFGPYVAPELGRFERESGEEGRLTPGDEFMVHINGPWDGPVRVMDVSPESFRLATREGHLEAGQIEFRAETLDGGDLLFTIESWARSRDAVVDVTYDDLGAAKAAQKAMWTFFCDKVAERAGGERVGEIEVRTEREAT